MTLYLLFSKSKGRRVLICYVFLFLRGLLVRERIPGFRLPGLIKAVPQPMCVSCSEHCAIDKIIPYHKGIYLAPHKSR